MQVERDGPLEPRILGLACEFGGPPEEQAWVVLSVGPLRIERLSYFASETFAMDDLTISDTYDCAAVWEVSHLAALER